MQIIQTIKQLTTNPTVVLDWTLKVLFVFIKEKGDRYITKKL
jgi:hypothetical protein